MWSTSLFQQLYVTSSDDGENEQINQSDSSTDARGNNEQSNSDNVTDNLDDIVEGDISSIMNPSANETAASVNETEATASEGASEEKECESSSCIVCQCDKVTVALLPCRHTCVCRYCLLRLDKCPMCRSAIQAYFPINGSQSSTGSYEPQIDIDDNPGNSPRWWVNLNQRINNFLGFS